jgi:hypothetical protein
MEGNAWGTTSASVDRISRDPTVRTVRQTIFCKIAFSDQAYLQKLLPVTRPSWALMEGSTVPVLVTSNLAHCSAQMALNSLPTQHLHTPVSMGREVFCQLLFHNANMVLFSYLQDIIVICFLRIQCPAYQDKTPQLIFI